MKKTLKKTITTPKIAIAVALVIAVAIGVWSTIAHNRRQAELFSDSIPAASDTNSNKGTEKDLTLAFPMGGRIASVSVKIGDKVKSGQVLANLDSGNALGAVNQARGAYAAAQTAYQKLINGASDTDIQIANVALNNAKTSYNTTVATQKVLVSNAYRTLLNSGLAAVPSIADNTNSIISPTISGTYTGTDEGTYTVTVYTSGNGNYFTVSGLESGTGAVSSVAVPLGTKGLYIQFPNNFTITTNTVWTVAIPNTQAGNYTGNYSAYQAALQNQTQAVTAAQGAVDAAQAALDQKVAGARSEDLAIAKAQVDSALGALQIAESAYNNTMITAPSDGTITNVLITAGQISSANAPAIELLSN